MIPQKQVTLMARAELKQRKGPNCYEVFVMVGKKCLQQKQVRSRDEAQAWLAEHWGLTL